MTDALVIRAARSLDRVGIERVYAAAFEGEELRPLLRRLLSPSAPTLSLVATARGRVAGHVGFTLCRVTGRRTPAWLLGPLAVTPALQRRGIGGGLIRAGLQRLPGGVLLVLGDPAYYSRFGFGREDAIRPPYPLPADWAEAWRAIRLDGATGGGRLIVPAPWRSSALWSG